ncbi:MAG: outer membrane beta-barrel protein [Sphingobium sp.]|uniref:outer membrane beta-barrel protein n=1 Tax=Sphingobium sp. TaxID=1912891 RepID=UPI0029BD27EB|nr:outer membrane beta-barrel protein [Sphingobium sp.]MDX3909290.1 outer membrane beta-barrel protein [Sphingobium sp.]
MKHFIRGLLMGCAAATALPTIAHAQIEASPLIPATLPDGFDKGRNVSVTERPRPDYDPLGVNLGSFMLFPKVETGVGLTSNVFLTNGNEESDGFAVFNPSVRARSEWDRHQVQLNASGAFRRFFDNSIRNEDAFNLGALGRLDIGDALAVTGEAQYTQQFETPITGDVDSSLAVLSQYERDFLSLRAQYGVGQGRLILAVDRSHFAFDPIRLPTGTVIDQENRDRTLSRVTAQAEYALTPSVSFYGQANYGDTNYDTQLSPGIANRDSDSYRFIVGSNFDLSALVRGTIGAGYARRNYDSALYKDVSGLSVEAKVEYFPTELTTFGLGLRRVIEDSNIGDTNAYFDNRATARVDHELLRNLILNAIAEYAQQDFISSTRKTTFYRGSAGARYFINRLLGLQLQLSYIKRDTTGDNLGQQFNEFRGQLTLVAQR